jgi:hypothetical protein
MKNEYVSNLKVLWISEKNGNGICIDNSGNECYIDSSIEGFEQLRRKDAIAGVVYRLSPDNILCVKSINKHFKTREVIKG